MEETTMSRNTVQFQKGMSLGEFMKRFGSEALCREALFKWRWPQGFVCPECGGASYCTLKSRALYQCHGCHHQSSLTAGTLFAGTKLPLTAWFLAMFLVTQSKNAVSALSLSRQLGVSYNSAWLIKHKLMQAMKERDDSRSLAGLIQLDDAYWGGERRGGKRGRGAPGKTALVAAVACNPDNGRPLALRLTRIHGFRSAEIRRWASHHLSPGCVVMSDALACFRAVEPIASHQPTVTGGGPASMELPEFHWVNTILGNVKNAIHGTYHAISAKHLPRYLAEFCYRFNRRFDLSHMMDRLGYVAARTPPLPHRLAVMAEGHW
jgi:transposase-like protein